MTDRPDDDDLETRTATDRDVADAPRTERIADLMGSDDDALARRLEAAAREVAVAAWEATAASSRARTAAAPQAAPSAGPDVLVVDPSRVRLLQWILGGTLVAMALAVFWPAPAPTSSTGVATPGVTAVGGERIHDALADLRARRASGEALGLPDEGRYEEALLLAATGDYAKACVQLEGLLADGGLPASVESLLRVQLAMYLRRAGRIGEAIAQERLARPDGRNASLAEDLLAAGREAAENGDEVKARRAYARFLLMQENLSPGLEQLLQEAWLQVGDSYRRQADGERADAVRTAPREGGR